MQVVQSGFSCHSSCFQAGNLKVKIEHPRQIGVFCLSSGQREAVWSYGYPLCFSMNLLISIGFPIGNQLELQSESQPHDATVLQQRKRRNHSWTSVRLRRVLATKMGTGAGQQFRHRRTPGPQGTALEQLGSSRCDCSSAMWCIV